MVPKVRPFPPPHPPDVSLAPAFSKPLFMRKLLEFYRKYRQYILSDGLMYVVFILALALMFVFFG